MKANLTWVAAFVLAILSVAWLGRREVVAPAPPEAIQRIRSAFLTETPGVTGKAAASQTQRNIRDAIEHEFARGHADVVLRFLSESIGREPEDGLVAWVHEAALFQFLRNGDRERLVRLLACGGFDRSSYWSVEDSITLHAPDWNHVNDGLWPLFDAFDAAKESRARKDIHRAVWRALGDAPLKSADAAEYMRAARAWYGAHQAHLKRTEHYDYVDLESRIDPPRHLSTLPEE